MRRQVFKWQSAISCRAAAFGPNGGEAGKDLPAGYFYDLHICEADVSGQSDSPPKTRNRVLIVDDNEALAMTYAWLLEDAGFAVETCHNGAQALECVEKFVPDIVLLDIGMPVMDGLQVCGVFRASEAWKDLAIVAQSGYGDDGMRVRAREAGFDRHLIKPIEFEDLLKTLSDVLAERQGGQSSDDPAGPL